jgi:hypothetical protein
VLLLAVRVTLGRSCHIYVMIIFSCLLAHPFALPSFPCCYAFKHEAIPVYEDEKGMVFHL